MAQKRFNPGTLSERVKFVRRTQGRDATTGEPTFTNTTVRETWAAITQPSGTYINSGNQVVLTKELKVMIRHRPDFTADNDMIVVWKGNEYVINSVPPNIDKRFDEIRISYES